MEKKALEDKLRCAEESNRLLRQALRKSEATLESGDSTNGSEANSPGPSNIRKRPSPALEEDFLEEEDPAPIQVPPLADDDLLRLSSYGMWSYSDDIQC